MGKGMGKLAFGSTTVCFLLTLFCTVLLQQGVSPLAYWKIQVSRWHGDLGSKNNLGYRLESLAKGLLIWNVQQSWHRPSIGKLCISRKWVKRSKEREELEKDGISCTWDSISDICVVMKTVRIDTRTSTVYHTQPRTSLAHVNRTVRPYARKTDKTCMGRVSPVALVSDDGAPLPCQVNHVVPAVVFSTSGFTGNLFHDFNDVILPLFITSRHFQSQVQFLITDLKPRWVSKFRLILTHLSLYDVIDSGKDGRVHCFPAAVIGLKYYKDLGFNSTDAPNGYSILDFKRFLKLSFSLNTQEITTSPPSPTLVLISRKHTRVFLNEDEIVETAKAVGFQVVLASPQQMSNLKKFARVVNSCDVLLGAHGAGLTNSLFLPSGGVLIQVVPLGLEWASTTYFGEPSKEMNLHYLEYRIVAEESSLYYQYPHDHPVLTDPKSIHMQGYNVSRAIYIDSQNLKLDLVRFRETLVEAMQLLRISPR